MESNINQRRRYINNEVKTLEWAHGIEDIAFTSSQFKNYFI